MKVKTLMAGLVAAGSLIGLADVAWKYDTSGRVGKYAAESSVSVSHAAAYDGRAFACSTATAVSTLSGFFDTHTDASVSIDGLSLDFNSPGFLMFLR